MAPLVSVVMSVFNEAMYLPAALESILSQTGVDCEFIIIDDGSFDQTPRILARYAARDRRIRLFTQQREGLTRALVRGCQEAHGELIARHDADDISLPDRLVKQARFLQSSSDGVTFLSCWAQAIGPEGEVLVEAHPPPDSESATKALLEGHQGPTCHGSVMMRRDAYLRAGGYRWPFYYGQDSDLWIRLAERGRLAFLPEILYQYRLTPQCISLGSRPLQAAYGRLARACQRARQQGADESPLLTEAASLRNTQAPARSHSDLARGNYFIGSCLKARGDRRASSYLWQAIRHRPWHLASWYQFVRPYWKAAPACPTCP